MKSLFRIDLVLLAAAMGALAQEPAAVVMEVDVEGIGYDLDEGDRTKFAKNPNITEGVPATNFGQFFESLGHPGGQW